MSRNANRAQLVLFYVERIESCDAEIAEQQAILKDKRAERSNELKAARSAGLNPKVIQQMVKERQMDPSERRVYLDECELYRAACGDLDGRPLSPSARRATMPPPTMSDSRTEDPNQDELSGIPPVPQPEPEPEITDAMLEEARAEGRKAHEESVSVLKNPYDAIDPRRAYWDMGWCEAAGNDGMDIPKALQPPKKGKKDGEDTEPEADNDDDEHGKAA